MVSLSAYFKDASVAGNTPTATEWNMLLQALETFINDAVQQQINPVFELTDGATVEVDWSNSGVQLVTVGGNRTFTFTGAKSGQHCVLIIEQNDTGGYNSQAFPGTMSFSGGSATQPTGTANKRTLYHMVYNDLNLKYEVIAVSTNH